MLGDDKLVILSHGLGLSIMDESLAGQIITGKG